MTAAGRDRSRVALYGFLWGIAVAALNAADMPLSLVEFDRVATFMAMLAPLHTFTGIFIAAYGQFAARHLTRTWTIVGAILAAPLAIALHVVVLRRVMLQLFDADMRLLGADLSLSTHVLFAGWHVVVFGGLLLSACVWTERTARTRALLAQAEIARGLAATQLGETELQALQADIDPAFLHRMLAQVRQTYAVRPADADALIDQLVAFLRAAMPAVRTGRSTVADELGLATYVAALNNQLDDGYPRRVVEVHGLPGDLPFPPLLLRLLDRLAAATPKGSELRLMARCDEPGVRLAVQAAGAGPWLDDALEYRLRVALRSIYGTQATLQVHKRPGPDAVALVIALPSAAVANAAWQAHPVVDLEGGPRWTIPATT